MAATPDDTRHALLRRARNVSQATLDVTGLGEWQWEAPSEHGTYEVKELEARSALTQMPPPYPGYSLNPYTGCSHACLYCYVPDVARVERPRWGSYVVVKRNLPTLLAREVKRREPSSVFLSSATDPYQPVEAEALVTRRCLEVLAGADWPLRVLTRSPLVLRDVDLLKRFSRVIVGMSVPTLDDEVRRILEPTAPPIEGRLKTLRRLADAGLDTYVSFAPAYPLTGGVTPDDIARALAEAGVKEGWVGSWNYMTNIRGPLAERLRGTPYEHFAEQVEDKAYTRHFFRRLDYALKRRGVNLHVYLPEEAPRAVRGATRDPLGMDI
ncbi:MAG TPA: radical SAM protein [Candidatus Thermoplasmatota archaeon]|nr:radical SAM protein [Candidatus Thermoplasmatota archaeon]